MIDQELIDQFEQTRKVHKYLTFMVTKQDTENWRCGVIQNATTRFISFYDIARIRDEKSRKRFLSFADEWWWQSNMSLPIDSFIGPAFDEFQYALTSIPRKTLAQDPIGPVYSLADQYLKRIKKKRIDLVNRKTIAA